MTARTKRHLGIGGVVAILGIALPILITLLQSSWAFGRRITETASKVETHEKAIQSLSQEGRDLERCFNAHVTKDGALHAQILQSLTDIRENQERLRQDMEYVRRRMERR